MAVSVYPRVCGGNYRPIDSPTEENGLSPRVRGKLPTEALGRELMRSIPACAGETFVWRFFDTHLQVYPRVCGGNVYSPRERHRRLGLSPRVRGKRQHDDCVLADARSIPACAGETKSTMGKVSTRKVYPRVCGGNQAC